MRSRLALAVLVAMEFSGCGKRGDPLPPLQGIPNAVNRPRVSQQGPEIVVIWQTPTDTIDGGTLELREAEVLRRVIEPPPVTTPEAPASPEVGEAGTTREGAPSPPAGQETSVPESIQGGASAPEPVPQGEPAATPESPEAATSSPAITVAAPRPESFGSEAKVIARIETTEPGDRLEYRDSWDPEWEGKRLEYAVRHVNRRGRVSQNSERSSIQPLTPVTAPSGLEASAANGWVRLTWSGSSNQEAEPESVESPKTEEVIDFGYNVYRRRKAAVSYPTAALNRRLLETTDYEDRDVEFRREWCYTVRRVAVRREPEPTTETAATSAAEGTPTNTGLPPDAAPPTGAPLPETEMLDNPAIEKAAQQAGQVGARRQPPEPPAVIESENSREVCFTPIDTFAPPVPEGVVALGVTGGVLLSWNPSEASDLAGYLVYRAARVGGPFELLNEGPIDVPSFNDQGLASGRTYFYAVSAVDAAEPPNESARSAVVSAQAPE